MKCTLHIGTEKTGTTILQNWLYANKNALSANGVYLSELIGKSNNRLLVCYFMDNFDDWFHVHSIDTNEKKEAYFKDFKRSFFEEVEAAKCNHNHMIITSEHFHSRLRKPELIEQLKDFLYKLFDEVQIVCYFREQSAMRKSLYSTALKVESDKEIEDFHNNIDENHYYYNYYDIANRWSSVFGKENCTYKIYERSRFVQNDLRADFIDAIGLQKLTDQLQFDISSANESLSYTEGVLYRVINEKYPLFLPGGGTNKLNNVLKQAVSSCDSLKKGKIVSKDSQVISKKFEQSNKIFFDEFFDGKTMFAPVEGDPNNEVDSQHDIPLAEAAKMLEALFECLVAESSLSLLENKDADLLRDVALKYESEDKVNKKEAKQLMLLAHRARPNGGLIKNKIKQYSE